MEIASNLPLSSPFFEQSPFDLAPLQDMPDDDIGLHPGQSAEATRLSASPSSEMMARVVSQY